MPGTRIQPKVPDQSTPDVGPAIWAMNPRRPAAHSIRTGACLASGLVRASSASGPMPNSSLGPEGLSVVAAGRAVVVVGTRRRVVVVGASLVGLGVAIAAGGTPALPRPAAKGVVEREGWGPRPDAGGH